MFYRFILLVILWSSNAYAEKTILHVSFDVTRELFKEINREFIQQYNDSKIKIRQSHGGSGKQTSAVIHGLPADVVSLALPYHMDMLAEKSLISKNWRNLFPNNSSPFSTYIVFLVKKNNPKQIKDWSDLARSNVKVITANPKTSGGALWSYAAAWIYANKNHSSSEAIDYMHKLYHNVPVLDATARGSAITFLKRHIGDVLITWNSEAKYIVEKLDSNYEIIEPSLTVKIDIPVAIINKHKEQQLAKEYLDFLFSKQGQAIIAKYYYQTIDNPSNKGIKVEDYINWQKFKQQHFGANGIFEQIYR